MQRLASDWLASVVKGAPPGWPFDSGFPIDRLIDEAQREGVVALVDWRLQRDATQGGTAVPLAVRQSFTAASRDAALLSMLFQAECLTVLHTMAEAGVPGLLLKGNALAYWAYPQPHLRACNDVDVLVPSREAAETLATCLGLRGFERSETSGELVAYELMCRRQTSAGFPAEVDIHWRLANSVLFANSFTFDELMAESIPLPALGANAWGLGPVHACIHACVHRALNLSIGVQDSLKWLYDIELMTRAFESDDWNRLVDLSRSKGLAGVVLSALEAVAVRFDGTVPQEVADALIEARSTEPLDASRLSDWHYMQRQTFKSLPTLGLKLRWVWQRLFPSKAYMGYLYGEPERSYLALMGLRLRRFLIRLNRTRR